MMYVAIMEAVVILAAILAIVFLVLQAEAERQDLEDRLMAICHPLAQTQVSAERNLTKGTVTFVDEEPYSTRVEKPNAHASS